MRKSRRNQSSDRAIAHQCHLGCALVSHPGPTLVLLVRHGATEWSTSGRHTGRTDIDLTDFGRDQVRRVRPVLRRLIDERLEGGRLTVFTSPLARAKETAALAMPDVDIDEVPMLAEVDYGDYEGLTIAEIHKIDPTWDVFTTASPGGDSPASAAARCDSFIAKMERVATGGMVVAFTHGHISRMLTARLLGLPVASGAVFYNDTASIAMVELRRGEMVLTGWNIGGQ